MFTFRRACGRITVGEERKLPRARMEVSVNKLKDREQRILSFMREEFLTKGYPPTVREICAAMNIKSTSTAHKSIAILVKEGYLKKDPAKPRALTLVDTKSAKQKYPTGAGENPSSESLSKNSDGNTGGNDALFDEYRHSTVDVPIVGRVAAGVPITAEENMDGTFPVPSEYASGNCFMLRVKGDSMINVGIMDGDLILVEQRRTANNGDIVVAMVDGFESEATVKTFYRESDHIRLQPENDTMTPIIVNDVSIQGKVKGVFRYFS